MRARRSKRRARRTSNFRLLMKRGWIPPFQGSWYGPVPPLGPSLEGLPRLAQGDHPII